ncbi:MAG: DUF4114 domain-containing protein [Chitinophagaceae bacterium]
MNKAFTLFIAVIFFAACNREKQNTPATKPVEFKETTYEFLGTYDSTGRPNYLQPKDPISSDLLAYINRTLPEGSDLRKTNPDLLNTNSIADISISVSSDVYITFVSQNTGSGNAIAFYTYPTANKLSSTKDIKTITYIFPTAGTGTTLQAGDKVKIGHFEPGISIGFVLLKGAFNSTTGILDNKVVHFCSNDILNPEVDINLKKHAVLLNYVAEKKLLIGFEDTDRTTPICDHDFQDVVLFATVTQ